MGTVTSILGCAYILPVFRDRRAATQFRAARADGRRPIVFGFRAPLDLVLHRTLDLHMLTSPFLRRVRAWTISERQTGCAVAYGATRQQALDSLAEYIAYAGGEDAFQEIVLRAATQQNTAHNCQ